MNDNTNHNSITDQPVIGVTMGDAGGIGPEIIVKAHLETGKG
jgi:4-hydroxy-L-threonine phosphate dehydrogenase PdxA